MSDAAYLGAQDVASSSTDHNSEIFTIQQEIAKVRTATLVKIMRAPYDENGNAIPKGSLVPVGFVDVQPLVNQIDGFGNAKPHGTIHKLSYHRYQGGLDAIIIDPEEGDVGKMVVADRDTSSVRATGMQANPGSLRKYDMADGTYFGCPTAAAPVQGVRFTATGVIVFDRNGNTITMDNTGVIIVDHVNGNNITMGSTGVLINGALINKSGDVITKNGHDLDTHIHSGVTTGSGDTGPPV